MDKRLIAERFAKAKATYSRSAQAQRQVAEKMLRLLLLHATHLKQSDGLQAVEIGCGTGIYSELLLRNLDPHQMQLIDLCPEMEPLINELVARHPEVEAFFRAADAEQTDLPSGVHLITSCSTVQWFEEPCAFVERCSEALASQGVLAFSTFGPDNLCEISALTGHGLHYPTLKEWKEMVVSNLHLLHAEEERITLWFPSPIEVLKHLKETGVTGTEKQVWSKQRLNTFCQAYRNRFGNTQGDVSLTYHPMYLIAKKLEV